MLKRRGRTGLLLGLFAMVIAFAMSGVALAAMEEDSGGMGGPADTPSMQSEPKEDPPMESESKEDPSMESEPAEDSSMEDGSMEEEPEAMNEEPAEGSKDEEGEEKPAWSVLGFFAGINALIILMGWWFKPVDPPSLDTQGGAR